MNTEGTPIVHPEDEVPRLNDQQLSDVKDRFAEFLRERQLRKTPERFAILEEIYRATDHFDADELYVKLRQGNVRVSRATVYNTLDLLMECSLVRRHQFGEKQAKYEAAHSYAQHDHLICEDCNELFEFCDPRIQGIQEMVAEIFQFDVVRHSLNLYGHCRRENCPNRKENEPVV